MSIKLKGKQGGDNSLYRARHPSRAGSVLAWLRDPQSAASTRGYTLLITPPLSTWLNGLLLNWLLARIFWLSIFEQGLATIILHIAHKIKYGTW
jgi:hypothetical protein